MMSDILDIINPWPATVIHDEQDRQVSTGCSERETAQWARAVHMSFIRSLKEDQRAVLTAKHELAVDFFFLTLQQLEQEVAGEASQSQAEAKVANHPLSAVHPLTAAYGEHVRGLLQKCGPYLQCLPQEKEGEGNTVSVALYKPNSYGQIKPFTSDEATALYVEVTRGEGGVALGQPVVHPGGLVTLGLCLGAYRACSCLPSAVSEEPLALSVSSALRLSALLVEESGVVQRLLEGVKRRWPESRFYGDLLVHPAPGTVRLRERMADLDAALLGVGGDRGTPSGAEGRTVASASLLSKAAEALFSLPSFQNRQGGPPKNALLYDWDAVQGATSALQAAFPPSTVHCFAAKAAPLPYLLHHFVQAGCGVEAASITEVRLALRAQCPPEKVVFDSPCKTYEEILEALLCGVTLNANTFHEVDKIGAALSELESAGISSSSLLGLRINPLVGGGAIAQLSTATSSSKFGVPLTARGRKHVVTAFLQRPWLRGLMLHVGSTGMALDTMTEGVAVVHELADEVDAAVREAEGKTGGEGRIRFIDIGGGLNANTDSDDLAVTFHDYVTAISARCPAFLTHPHRTVMTEFGKSLVLKTAGVLSRVEDVLRPEDPSLPITAIVHAGADLFLRPAYVPSVQSHRMKLLDCAGRLRDMPLECVEARREVTIAGPLCHSTDFLARKLRDLPEPGVGEWVLVLDCGGNTLSTFSKHCSRLTPPVFAFRRVVGGGVTVVEVREEESELAALDFWN